MRSVFLVAFALLGISGCSPGKETKQGNAMLGLTASNSGSFTITDDGSALSVLLDAMDITYGPKSPEPKGGSFARKAEFSLRNRAGQLPLRAFLRGFVKHPATAKGKLMLTLDSRKHDLSAQVVDEDFTICVDFVVPNERTDIGINLELPYQPEQSALLQLESIDVVTRKANEKPDKDCKTLPEK